jgi:hypothetical protein
LILPHWHCDEEREERKTGEGRKWGERSERRKEWGMEG